jgi:cardiolipin synthase
MTTMSIITKPEQSATRAKSGPAAPPANPFLAAVEQATGTPYRPGNQFTVLQNGDQIFPLMLAAINSARTSIEFVTYVYWRSHIASQFADALCERARAGVSVRLLIDAVGGAVMNSRTVWQLERSGVQVAWFRPLRWPYLRRLNNRTHRKILLIDGHTGFTGGVGIADEWTGSAGDPQHWRETHCRIIGPACADLRAGFAENWREATHERLVLADSAPVSPAGPVAVHTTSSTAGPQPTAVELLLHAAIATATRRLWITTAYFVPNAELAERLIAAADRGVDVRVLTNGPRTNHRITRLAGQAAYPALLAAGVHIYEYRPTVLHAKVVTADSTWATIGSTNLDDRSLVLNDELNVSVADPAIAAALDRQFLADLDHSTRLDRADWPQRHLAQRAAIAAASVFRHQL